MAEENYHVKDLVCEFCQKTFPSKTSTQKHVEYVHKGRSYLCTICGEVMRGLSKRLRHQRSHCADHSFFVTFYDDKQKRYPCAFLDSNDFKQCDACLGQFSSRNEKWHHFEEVHRKRKFRCLCCLERINSHLKLSTHVANHQENVIFETEYDIIKSSRVLNRNSTAIAANRHSQLGI